jgi:hypothetical protein
LKYAQLVISLPLLLLPLSILPVKSALAETVGVGRALELLAKSTAIDTKCNVLSTAEREELSSYTSRAEIAGAEKTSVESTRAALASGRKAGFSTICSPQASADVKDTLNAARDAISAVAQNDATMQPNPEKPRIIAKKTASLAAAPAVKKPQAIGKLSAYTRVTEAYFLERKCTYLSKGQIMSFYKAVLRNHRAAISQFGKASVSSAKKIAEANANAQSCNGAGEALVQAGFSEIASR